MSEDDKKLCIRAVQIMWEHGVIDHYKLYEELMRELKGVVRMIDADRLMLAIDKETEMHTIDGDTYVKYDDICDIIIKNRSEEASDEAD